MARSIASRWWCLSHTAGISPVSSWSKETVGQLRVSGEFVQLIARMQLVHSKVGVIGARTGAEVRALFKMWDQQSEDLT